MKKSKIRDMPIAILKKLCSFEFSKLILIFWDLLTIFFIFFASYEAINGNENTSYLVEICIALIGMSGTGRIFYYIKTKSDNKIKMLPRVVKELQAVPEELRNQIDINQIINTDL